MRRLIAVAVVGLGCASPGMPPGGPPDAAAPEIVSITPDSGKVGVKPKEVLFRFDEVVSERPPGATTLGDLFLISPRDGVPQASWHREVIGVRPAHGWRNNTPYTVIMMRGLADLRGNVRNTGAATFFSTGSSIPATRITGTVFDWVAGTPAKGALVESFVPPDTLHPYVALVDSNGLFAIEHVPPARYVLRAYIDRNKNLSVDPSEPWDSVGVTLSDSVQSTLLIFVHDTVPPRLRELRYVDSVTIQAAFDRPIDPAQSLGVANFAVTGPDSTAVPIASVNPPAVDTTAARPGAPTPAAAAARPAGGARQEPTRPDTAAAAPKPVMPKPSPVSEVVIKLQRALTPKAVYRVRAIGIRGLLGKVGDSERTLTIPAPVPAATPPTPPKGAASSTPSALR